MDIEELREKKLYRSSKMRAYYAIRPTTETPTPFVEFRVFMIHTDKIDEKKLEELFDKVMNDLEFIFISIRIVRETEIENIHSLMQAGMSREEAEAIGSIIRYETVGYEFNREITVEEAIDDFRTTGLPVDEWILNEVYRYVAFYDIDGFISHDYNEAQIREIEARGEIIFV